MNENDSMTFADMVQMMKAEYGSDARREQVWAKTQNLNLKKHIKHQDISDEHERLTAIVNILHKLTPQRSPEFSSEQHMIR